MVARSAGGCAGSTSWPGFLQSEEAARQAGHPDILAPAVDILILPDGLRAVTRGPAWLESTRKSAPSPGQ